jgi:hypothetical protein
MANSWLFTRDHESIHLSRAEQFGLILAGPGRARQQLAFDSEAAIEQYQRELAERMAAGGWILYGVDRERRDRNRTEGRHAPERRLRN